MSIKRGIAISFGRSGSIFVLQFASNIVLARLLLPSEIGIFSTALAMLAVLHSIRDFGFGRYLIQEQDLTEHKIRTVFGVAVLIGWTLGAIIFLSRHAAAEFYREPQIAGILALLSINFFLLPFGQPAFVLLRRERRYLRLSAISLSSVVAGTITSIIFAVLGYGPFSLAYGALANTGTTVVLSLVSRPDHLLMLPSFKEWRSIYRFGSLDSASTLVMELGNQAPDLLLGRFLGFSAVGLFSRGQGISAIVRRLFSQAVGWVMGTELAAMLRARKSLAEPILNVTSHMTAVGWPALIFLAFNAHAIIWLLYGETWLPAAPLAQALCVYEAVKLLVSQANAMYEGTGDVGLRLRNAAILQVTSVVFLVIGSAISLLAVAWLRVPVGVAEVVVHSSVYRRHSQVGLRRLVAACYKSLLIASAIAVTLAVLHLAEPTTFRDTFPSIFTDAAACAIVYLVMLYATRHPLLEHIKSGARSALTRVSAGASS